MIDADHMMVTQGKATIHIQIEAQIFRQFRSDHRHRAVGSIVAIVLWPSSLAAKRKSPA
ncbi:MAG: hypothetical protein J7498_06995 [Sphingobium sp.]|nr:hypothetical protein [Sphingobium sp.]